MKISNFIFKLLIVNGLIALFILGTYLTISYFINTKLNEILFERKIMKSIETEMDKVNIYLLKSAVLKDKKYLVLSAMSSNKVESFIHEIDKKFKDTKELKNDYLEFFKYTVMTTSMFIENRDYEAKENDILSEEKQQKFSSTLHRFVKNLDQIQSNLIDRMNFLMLSSYVLLLIILIGNIFYIYYHFRLSKRKDYEMAIMMETIGHGVYGVDLKGNCIFINQSALQMIQFSKDEVLYQHQHHLFHHHKPDGTHYESEDCPIYKTVVDKKTRIVKEHFIKKDGTFFPVTLTVVAIENLGAIVVFKDITQELLYEQTLQNRIDEKTKELQELNSNLEETIKIEIEKNKQQFILLEQQSRLAALGEMIGNISHQWRQPLSVITTSVSGLKVLEEMGVPITHEMITNTSDAVLNQANYLSRTIDDFRDFIKNDTVNELFYISKVIEDTANLLDATLKSNEISLILNLDNSISYNGHASQLSQVIMNIINNAKDTFNEKNQEFKQIEVKTTKEKNLIKIEIIDNAGGINDEIKSKIFDPYFTTKHQSQGTGLGLYICTKIIQKSFNGKIYIEDITKTIGENSYKGTNFIIEFDVKIEEEVNS